MGERDIKGGGPGRSRALSPVWGMPLAGFVGCGLLFGMRFAISGRAAYTHLLWNLSLALVPYLVAAAGGILLGRVASPRRRNVSTALVALLWLVFFPNASYIFTDFIHVFNRTYLRVSPSDWLGLNAIIWYDILMNAAFAFVGHLLGLVSLWMMSRVARVVWGRRASNILLGAAILFSGFGIYLGRFSRLNSWDVVASPQRVFSEVAEATTDPKALMFSAAFSAFIFLSYASLAAFKAMPEPETNEKQ
jgi:uncharacterized membrane protein